MSYLVFKTNTLVSILFTLATTHQTFVLMKTSWRRLEDVFRLRLQKTSSRRLQDVLIKTNIFVLAIRLQGVFKTFSRRLQDVFKTFSRRPQDIFKIFWRRLQDVFKTSSRPLEGVFKTSSRRLQDVFNTSSRRPAKISSRRFQGVPSS